MAKQNKLELQLTINPDDQKRISVLLDQEKQPLSITVPLNVDPEQLWNDINICCTAFGRIEKVAAIMKPLIGRMLLVLQNYPLEFWESKQFKSFGDFMARGVQKMTGTSMPEAYKLLSLARDLSSVPPIVYQEVGYTKLCMLAKVAQDGSSTLPQWIEIAKKCTSTELKEAIYESKNGIEPGKLDLTTIHIHTTGDVQAQWEEMIGTPEIQWFCNSANPGVILQRMMQEVITEWMAQAAQASGYQEKTEDGFVVVEAAAVEIMPPPIEIPQGLRPGRALPPEVKRERSVKTRSEKEAVIPDITTIDVTLPEPPAEQDDAEWPLEPGQPSDADFDSIFRAS